MGRLEDWLKNMRDKELRHLNCKGTKSDFAYCHLVWNNPDMYCRDLEDGTYCVNKAMEERNVFYPIPPLKPNE